MSVLRTINGQLVINALGQLLTDICACLCRTKHVSPCNFPDTVPDILHVTVNHAAITKNLDIVWNATACSGSTEGWSWDAATVGDEIAICPGFTIVAVHLCCKSGPTIWNLEATFRQSGILTDYQTGGSFSALVVNDTNPVDYTVTTPGQVSTACGLDFITVTIAA